MSIFNRRNFLKASGAGLLPALTPFATLAAGNKQDQSAPPTNRVIKFFGDGQVFEPVDYLNELGKANAATSIITDRYGEGGVVTALQQKFVEMTGKEKAIYMPSGTMANQLAISVLSGEKTKVIVQETSHVYRDEADSAQTVFNKRLIPLAKGETFFTAAQLQSTIDALKDEEAFDTGIGAVSIENPVRRTFGQAVPLEEIIRISKYCRSKNIKLHLDGARIYIASGWTGVSVKEYASYFDTVYISLYKYFGAASGAMLCGPAEVIDKMAHLIKVHGGALAENWTSAAMALYRIEGFETRLQNAIKLAGEVFNALNKLPGIQVKPMPGGTNIYDMQLAKEIDGAKFQEKLSKEFNIEIRASKDKSYRRLGVNETILFQSADYIVNAFKKSMQPA
jgi:threonine aldolase